MEKRSLKAKLYALNRATEKNLATVNPLLPDDSVLSQLNARLVENDYGQCLYREKKFSLEYVHSENLSAFLDIKGSEFTYLAKDPGLKNLQPRQCLFFDTETTGLAGGTGTYIFLAGLGLFEDNEFIVKQYFMMDYDQEPALLYEIAKHVNNAEAFISYNGKSYDVPLLKTRFLLHQVDSRVNDILHLDLVHTARRLWKKNLESCSLQNLEQNLLGFRREGDVPGAEIPAMFFAYLQNKDLLSLKGIFQHNVLDIVSMVSIAVKAQQVFSQNQPAESQEHDELGVIKTFERLGYMEKAIESCHFYIKTCQNSDTIQLKQYQAIYYKKSGSVHKAELIWLDILKTGKTFLPDIYVELAKYYEHHLKDIIKALDIVEKAEKRIDISQELAGELSFQRIQEDLRYRKNRLLKKKEYIIEQEKYIDE